ncbi:MAG: hypothetical protein ACK4UN_12320 [Limisphaerales bacterium]
MGKNDEVTIEELAEMTARGFAGVDERLKTFATKDELAEMKTEILENFGNLQRDVSGQLNLFLNTIRKDYENRLSKVEEEVHDLAQRV